MSVSITTVRNRCVEILNQSDPTGTYGAFSVTAEVWVKTQEFTDSILGVDAKVVDAICNNPKHPRRRDYPGSSAVAHGARMPAHIGPIENVLIGSSAASIPRHPDPKQEIERERTNTLNLTTIEPHYFIENDTLYHNGASAATVNFCTFTLGVACQSPDEHLETVVDGSLATMFDKDGHRPDAAAYRNGRFVSSLQSIALVGQEAA